ncbi:MAG: sulfatase-like hydrolase/transferase [Myxococcota bacterium]
MSGPPLVLVLFDQLRADVLGHGLTPRLDALAAQAVTFPNAVTDAALCRPARVTLATGLPVHAHGLDSNRTVADPAPLPSHVRRLRDEAGYHTVVVGKTHLHAGTGHLDDHLPRLRAWGYADAVELPDAQEHRLGSAHGDALTADQHRRWREYVAARTDSPPDAPPWDLPLDLHLDVFCARTAAARIRAWDGDAPPYLQVCFPGPHPPFDAPRAFRRDPDDPALPPPILAPSRGPVPPVRVRYRRGQARRTERELRDGRARYLAKVALLDHCLGIVLDALRDARWDPWLVVTADHGELAGDHGLFGKVLAWDGALRVPLLVRPPGGTVGRTDDSDASLRDVAETLGALGGIGPGALAERVLQPLPARRRPILSEALGHVALRDGPFTFGWDRATGRAVELYDRRDDPLECHNRVGDPALAEAEDRLTDALHTLRPGLRPSAPG